MKTIVIGVMPQEQVRARAIAIARGEYKPKPGEPKIWFTSMKSVAEVLSDQNRALLKVIRETNPDSMAMLAKATGRQPGNLSRTAVVHVDHHRSMIDSPDPPKQVTHAALRDQPSLGDTASCHFSQIGRYCQR